MVINEVTAKAFAHKLEDSEQQRIQIRQIAQQFPAMSIADAYQVQKAWVQLKLAKGHAIRGHKVGLTSRAMQLAFALDEPDYGVLFDYMFYLDGDSLPMENFIVPRVEVELAFILKKDLQGPGVGLAEVYEATAYVQPALEIIDARFHESCPQTGTARTVLDTIADNAANAGIVLGGSPASVDAFDMRWVGAILSKNAQIEETGLAAGVMNHPANGVAWLANKLAEHGVGLEAGQVILSGSFTRPVVAQAGDVFHADYGRLGTIQCKFV